MKIPGDRLHRAQEVEHIVKIIEHCVALHNASSFSIEGPWGIGKTWLLERIIAKLNGEDLYEDAVGKGKSINYFCKRYLVVNYNAWEKDYCEEPLIAILITLVKELNRVLKIENIAKGTLKLVLKNALETLSYLASIISKRVLGVDIVGAGIKSVKAFKELKENSKLKLSNNPIEGNIEDDITCVVKTLNKVSKYCPIVFIVDELDRCMPSYAIKTLERLHHVFRKVENSVTIISVFREQLDKSICEMFGDEIKTDEYLKKFIDFKIVVSNGEVDGDEVSSKFKDLSACFLPKGGTYHGESIINFVCENTTSREFENIFSKAFLCHNIAQLDTSKLPYECFEAEILLQLIKIVLEKEKNIANIIPYNGNIPDTILGKNVRKLLDGFLQKVKMCYQDANQLLCFSVNNSCSIVLLIVQIIFAGSNWLWSVPPSDEDMYHAIKNHYFEYKSFFDLIK